MKTFVTEQNVAVERKGQNIRQIRQCLVFVFTSNHLPKWMEEGERRYLVIETDHDGHSRGEKRAPKRLSGAAVSRGNGLPDNDIFSIWLNLPLGNEPFLKIMEYTKTVNRGVAVRPTRPCPDRKNCDHGAMDQISPMAVTLSAFPEDKDQVVLRSIERPHSTIGFGPDTQVEHRVECRISSVLHLGNVAPVHEGKPYSTSTTVRVSYRDLEEIMAERGVPVDHATLNRWVEKYAGAIADEAHHRKRPTCRSWRMDETYI